MTPLIEGRRRERPCISLRALLIGSLVAVPLWTLVVYLVVANA